MKAMKYSKQIRKIMEINLINGLDGCDCWVIAKYQLAVENTKCFYHCVFSQWIINDFVIFFPLMTDRQSTWTLWKLTKKPLNNDNTFETWAHQKTEAYLRSMFTKPAVWALCSQNWKYETKSHSLAQLLIW